MALAKQRKFLFPVRAVAALFRGKFLAGLAQMLDAGELHPPDSKLKTPLSRACWFSLLYSKRWVLYSPIIACKPKRFWTRVTRCAQGNNLTLALRMAKTGWGSHEHMPVAISLYAIGELGEARVTKNLGPTRQVESGLRSEIWKLDGDRHEGMTRQK